MFRIQIKFKSVHYIVHSTKKLRKYFSRNWKLWSDSAKKSLTSLTNKSNSDMFLLFHFHLSCHCKQIINQHSYQNYVHPSNAMEDWWWIQEFAKNQQKHPVRINFLYGIYSEDYCTFHYSLQIVCCTLFISVKSVIICICI